MKRWISLSLCLLLLLPCTAFAQSISYGDYLKCLKMFGTFPNNEFWNMYAGREACSFSEEAAYRGGTSLKVDVNALLETEKQQINFESQRMTLATYGADQNSLCFEWHLKGVDEDIYAGRITFSAAFYWEDGTSKVVRDGLRFEEPDEDGWVKVWVTVPKSTYRGAAQCTFGIFYDPNRSGSMEVDSFYIDELSVRIVPERLVIRDISADSSVKLDHVRVFGLDAMDTKQLLTNKTPCNWSVVSGEGRIVDDHLLFTGEDKGDVVVKCEYFGIETTFTVRFEPEQKAYYSALSTNEEGSISVTVYNKGEAEMTSSIIFALFDGERLYSAQTVKASLLAGDSAEITSGTIRISGNIKEPVIKVYAWDSFGGMSVLR